MVLFKNIVCVNMYLLLHIYILHNSIYHQQKMIYVWCFQRKNWQKRDVNPRICIFFSTLYKIIFLIPPNIFRTIARGLHFFLYLKNEYLISIWFIFSCLYNFSKYTWNMNWKSDYKYHFVFRFLCSQSQDTKISKCAMTICNCVYYDWTTTCMFSYSM